MSDGMIAKILRTILGQATPGLEGNSNCMDYRIAEIERHFHGVERYYGDDGDNTMSVANSLTPWVLTAGTSEAFGTEVQIAGANDVIAADFPFTPVKFEPHEIMVKTTSATGVLYEVELWSGETTFGAATRRGVVQVIRGTGGAVSGPMKFQSPRISVAEKLWLRCKCETDSATITCGLGLHAYEG